VGPAILGDVMVAPGRLVIGWLYPDLLNIYGDRGNVLTLVNRARWRGLEAEVRHLGSGPIEGLEEVNLFFVGGGQDRDQALVFQDLVDHKAAPLRAGLDRGAVALAVCGGYQLLGQYYRTADGDRLPGIGLLDLYTEAGATRCIGDVVIESDPELGLSPSTVVGFENHSGRTFLGASARPLGRVLSGYGNNAQDHQEGAVCGNLFGTYLHGSLLPKNPHLADLLIARALGRELEPLEDDLELSAHRRIAERTLGR
jgi:lipid II isoglutaminyl synthase (glutamine-hydrolysing)